MYVEQGRGYKQALFNLCLINVCIAILHVNLKWQAVTSFRSEKFVQCAFCNKANQEIPWNIGGITQCLSGIRPELPCGIWVSRGWRSHLAATQRRQPGFQRSRAELPVRSVVVASQRGAASPEVWGVCLWRADIPPARGPSPLPGTCLWYCHGVCAWSEQLWKRRELCLSKIWPTMFCLWRTSEDLFKAGH